MVMTSSGSFIDLTQRNQHPGVTADDRLTAEQARAQQTTQSATLPYTNDPYAQAALMEETIPTVEFRFLYRPNTSLYQPPVLQQRFRRGNNVNGWRDEWRDVPTVVEA